MLYDTLENLNQYTGLFPNLDKAIDFIEDNDVSALPLGRTEIDGCCFSKRMRKVFRKNEKSMLQNCNKKAKRKGRLQRVKKPM